jgi:hypothetical protein
MTIYKKNFTDRFELKEGEFSTLLFKKLIRNWHEKATTEDYFSKFVFEYLAFAAILRKYSNVESKSDRDAIEWLKKNKEIKEKYLERIGKEVDLTKLIDYLRVEPVENNDKKVKIEGDEDWPNMVEFVYSVRNNLFHGSKDPEDARDKFLVEYAYELLRPLVEILLNKIGMGEEH